MALGSTKSPTKYKEAIFGSENTPVATKKNSPDKMALSDTAKKKIKRCDSNGSINEDEDENDEEGDESKFVYKNDLDPFEHRARIYSNRGTMTEAGVADSQLSSPPMTSLIRSN